MPSPWRTAGSLIAVLAAVAAGCGGSGPLDREGLISEGDELCRAGQAGFERVQAEPPATAAEALSQTEDLVEESERELDGLRDLKAPAELRQDYERYLEARERALELLEGGRDAAERRDGQAYAAAQERSRATVRERRRLARAVGFEDCSQPGGG